MRRLGLPLRTFLALLTAATPPALGILVAVYLAPSDTTAADLALTVGGLILASVAWIAVVAVAYSRVMRQELDDVLGLAEHGELRDPTERASEGDATHRRVAASLDERNRQVAELAAQVSQAPIGDDPHLVAEHVVRAARSVTRDPTWLLAVLDSAIPEQLPPGVYDAGAGSTPAAIDDLHRWASVAASERLPARTSRVEGPWGAFVVISLAADESLRAILLAPWEGRTEPSSSEFALLSLIGEHAATAIEHALLYARVHAQAEDIDRMATIQRDFLRAVSHDLQTPLTSIRAVAAELRAQAGLDEQARSDLDLIEHQSDRLRRMVAQLLVVSRLEAGVVEPLPEVINPRTIVERTWAALRAPDRAFELEVTGPPLLVVADPDRLEQVLWAILDNAVKYSPAGRPVRVSIGPRGDRAVISITDDGMGMDAQTTQLAFEQFFRASDARRLAPDGSGIGLYAARGLMEAMGGAIGITSRAGHGTTVDLELPAELAAEGVAPAPAQSEH